MARRDKFPFSVVVPVILLCQGLVCQELDRSEIFQLNYDSIIDIERSLEFDDPYLRKVLKVHIAKAKYLRDTSQLIQAYRYHTWTEEFPDAKRYIDSALHLARLSKDAVSLALVHYAKGILFFENEIPDQAILELVRAYKTAQLVEDHETMVDCMNLIASIKREYGQEEEALLLHREALKHLRDFSENIESLDLTRLITLDNLARCYLQVMGIDSARAYAERTKHLAVGLNELQVVEKIGVLQAQINYYDGNYVKARDSLLDYVHLTEGISRADIYYYLGMAEQKLNRKEKSLEYLRQFDSVLQTLNYPLIDNTKSSYQALLRNAMEVGDSINQRKFFELMVHYDSLTDITEKRIRNLTLVQFDIPMQQERDRTFLETIKFQGSLMKFFYALIAIILGISAFLYQKYRTTKKKLKEIMRGEIATFAEENTDSSDALDIDPVVARRILDGLNSWEKEDGYLDSNVNQQSLAERLQTNSTYLSKVVNTYKKQNFPRYLKDLRITRAINFLKNNPETVENRSMIQIAEQFGFSSLDVFSRAFKAKIGVTPGAFFKELRRGNL